MRKVLRLTVLACLGFAGAGLVLLVASIAIGGYEWTNDVISERLGIVESKLRTDLVSSASARWWRCLGEERPLLAADSHLQSDWIVNYSWTGGYGEGDYYLTVASDGKIDLRVQKLREGDPILAEAEAPGPAIARLAEAIDETGFLCLTPMKRENHHIIDLGRYSVRVQSAEYSKEIFAGGCYYIKDTQAFDTVLDAIDALEEYLDVPVPQGPFATVTMDGACY